MLPRVAHQENAIICMKATDKIVHLLGRSERALVQDVEALFASIGSLSFGQVSLQS